MKICTKTGDLGETSINDLERMKKSEIVFDVLGTVDELSSHIGLVKAADKGKKYFDELEAVQKSLIKLMSGIASSGDIKYDIKDDDILCLERRIKDFEKSGADFCFALSGKTELSARLDVARCVARRAERLMVKAEEKYSFCENYKAYLNRLSDYLFVLARNEESAE